MPSNKFLRLRIPLKELAPAVVLVLNSFVWFALTTELLRESIQGLGLSVLESSVLNGTYYIGIAVSAFLGALLFPRARDRHLLLWMFFGTLITMLPTTFEGNSLTVNVFLCLFLGISIGAGLPSTLACFADATVVENRCTYGGLTWSTVGFTSLALALGVILFSSPLNFVLLSVWRAAGTVVFFALSKRRDRSLLPTSVPSFRSIISRKDVTLYLLPWIMFSLVNFAESPILENVFGEAHFLIGFIEFAVSGVFAVVGGIFGDLVGRKRVVITGFIILGIEYAILSLFSEVQASWYVYTFLDGIAWGMFASVFFMALWGDLAEPGQKEKYYVLGGLPYLLAGFLPVVVRPFAAGIQTITAFSLASFFLFVAVLPLMYAPETLPEKRIKERELRNYLEKAKKAKEKYA